MATKKNTTPDRQLLISKYTDHCLVHGKRPESVYKFAKDNGFEESHFYKHFSSFEALEKHFFAEMFNHTLEILEKSPAYTEYSGTEKLSAFYFTFFELATANRSFVMFALKEGGTALRNLVKLKELRTAFLPYAEAILEKPFETYGHRVGKVQDAALREGAWLQFLSILKFWMDDTSASFEKTDIFIEKSVKASADLVYNIPLKSVLDLGKFIWKEKFNA
ncbi:TetR family transcriptional regulator C-terminal domain-containing protein [Flavobacterium sp. MFBS3-15]|uniref:TetR family transcriptional regulator C-terminal domain-containing protein n=1 Tax=Flavobacterium sp. MFBS3-15 TaxID=2989816 RepID=UPI0022358EDD|nr:TetR family transcriptional regulator C-terminal domain-containing protein [Flavobacterium sp. MFBS3-15]MCW4469061.1 TetR family transcriptional regulator C-terminal domain-containing protein [Flavobacterium sp. MFBS3-15]